MRFGDFVVLHCHGVSGWRVRRFGGSEAVSWRASWPRPTQGGARQGREVVNKNNVFGCSKPFALDTISEHTCTLGTFSAPFRGFSVLLPWWSNSSQYRTRSSSSSCSSKGFWRSSSRSSSSSRRTLSRFSRGAPHHAAWKNVFSTNSDDTLGSFSGELWIQFWLEIRWCFGVSSGVPQHCLCMCG